MAQYRQREKWDRKKIKRRESEHRHRAEQERERELQADSGHRALSRMRRLDGEGMRIKCRARASWSRATCPRRNVRPLLAVKCKYERERINAGGHRTDDE